jgi:hypothetical protein
MCLICRDQHCLESEGFQYSREFGCPVGGIHGFDGVLDCGRYLVFRNEVALGKLHLSLDTALESLTLTTSPAAVEGNDRGAATVGVVRMHVRGVGHVGRVGHIVVR